MLCRLRAALFDNTGSDRRRDKTFVLLNLYYPYYIRELKANDVFVNKDVRLPRGDWIKNCVCVSLSVCGNLQHI